MNDELKYCKFCDKTKPKKEFCKSGGFTKNICRECQNKKQKEKYNASKNWNELKKWCKQNIENVEWTSLSEDYLTGLEDTLDKMQELEGNNE